MEELVRRILADASTKGAAILEDTFHRLMMRRVTYLLIAILLLPTIGAYYAHKDASDITDTNSNGEKIIYEEDCDEGGEECDIVEVTVEKRVVGDFLDVFYGFYLRLMLLIVALSLAIGLIQDEKEDKTLPLLMTTPLTRFELLMYKYAAAVPLITAIIWGPVVVFYLLYVSAAGSAAVFGNLGLLGVSLLLIFLSVAAYTAVFFAISTALKHPLLGGISFIFLWEIFLGGWGHSIQKITISHYVRSAALPLLSEFTGKDEALQNLDLLDFSQHSLATGWVSALLALVIISLSFLSFAVVLLRYKDSS